MRSCNLKLVPYPSNVCLVVIVDGMSSPTERIDDVLFNRGCCGKLVPRNLTTLIIGNLHLFDCCRSSISMSIKKDMIGNEPIAASSVPVIPASGVDSDIGASYARACPRGSVPWWPAVRPYEAAGSRSPIKPIAGTGLYPELLASRPLKSLWSCSTSATISSAVAFQSNGAASRFQWSTNR